MKIKKFKEYNESIGDIINHSGSIVLGLSAAIALGSTLQNVFTRNKLYRLYNDYIRDHDDKVNVTEYADRYFIQLHPEESDINFHDLRFTTTLMKNEPILITSTGIKLKLKNDEYQKLINVISKKVNI